MRSHAPLPSTLNIGSCERAGTQHLCLAVIAAAALGAAIQVRDGLYHPLGFLWLTVALFAALLIFVLAPYRSVEFHLARRAPWLFAAAIALNFFQLFTNPTIGSWHGIQATRFSYAMLTIAFVFAMAVVFMPRAGRLFLVLLTIVFCIIGAWIIRSVPRPYMDVWMLQTEGLKAFRSGHNPFAAVFADVYHRPELYATGALKDGLVHQGFPYPPMVFWMDLPGYVLGGDYRWSNLAEIALAGILIAFARPQSRYGPMAAALFLFTPRVFFVLESGWTEPATILLLAATVFFACRLRWLMPVFLGLFLCSKQYLVWAIPPIILLAGRPVEWKRLARVLSVALVAGCVASLPLILWDMRAFVTANFGIADIAAFRMDALSYLALFANTMHRVPSGQTATLIGFTAAALATLLATLRGQRTPAGYALAVTVGHLVFFAFYKFAFCNYYYFLIAAFCCGTGAMRISSQGTAVSASEPRTLGSSARS